LGLEGVPIRNERSKEKGTGEILAGGEPGKTLNAIGNNRKSSIIVEERDTIIS
jgi:hypothetical protein